MVMNLHVPQRAENFLTSWGTICFSRGPYLHDKGKGKTVPVFSFNWAPRHEGVLG